MVLFSVSSLLCGGIRNEGRLFFVDSASYAIIYIAKHFLVHSVRATDLRMWYGIVRVHGMQKMNIYLHYRWLCPDFIATKVGVGSLKLHTIKFNVHLLVVWTNQAFDLVTL